MFILKRQDVEISAIQHPNRDQQVSILHYQGQAFRLISVFKASQEEEARALWRELTDNRGKACVLLEEPDRFSIWGKIRLEQVMNDTGNYSQVSIFIQASILLLQALYMDVKEFLGTRQGALFEKDIAQMLQQKQFPGLPAQEAVKYLLSINPMDTVKLPTWSEKYVKSFLQELYTLGKAYFGNDLFVDRVIDRLQDMPASERSLFISWLNQSSLSKLWQ